MSLFRTFANLKCVPVRSLSSANSLNAWFGGSAEAVKRSGHSALLSGAPQVYEIVSDSVSPANWEQYLEYKVQLLDLRKDHSDLPVEHLASWHFIYGDVIFRAMHMYKYPKGWEDIDRVRMTLKKDSKYKALQTEKGFKIISQQSTEFMKSFAYWPAPTIRQGENIYDVRSYRLTPGSMYDWGNYWAKGIDCRRNVREDTLFGGFFTQVGHLQTVYHIWVYKSMTDRKTCRDDTWKDENWSNVVANTVPLVKNMKTRILEPLPFSPTQ